MHELIAVRILLRAGHMCWVRMGIALGLGLYLDGGERCHESVSAICQWRGTACLPVTTLVLQTFVSSRRFNKLLTSRVAQSCPGHHGCAPHQWGIVLFVQTRTRLVVHDFVGYELLCSQNIFWLQGLSQKSR